MKTIINTYTVRERNFTIVFDNEYYLAIEDCYIDENGRLNQKLNGLTAHASETLDACLESVREQVEIAYLMENGMTKAEAFCTVLEIPITDQIRAMFDK